MKQPRSEFLIEMARTWEDLGVVFQKGLRLVVWDAPVGEQEAIPDSDFYYHRLHHVSKAHCRVIGENP